MDWTLELVAVPVTDLDAGIEFYRDGVGFHLDHEVRNDYVQFAQLTPRGSGCSIVIGNVGSSQAMPPGSLHGLQLVVADAVAGREELVSRGVGCDEISVIDERDGGTLFGFRDPDGNSWTVQQLRDRAEHPLIPGS